jgi:hypothetical protein
MSDTVIEMPAPELESRALTVVDEARAVVIVDQESLNRAGSFITERIKPLLAEADEVFDPVISSAHKAHKEAIAAKLKVAGPLIQAEGILKAHVGTFLRDQERNRQAEERRLREAEEARLLKIREEQIEAAENAGAEAGLVKAICEEPLPEPAPVSVPAYQKPAGITTRETWNAQVTSIKELCRAVAEGKVPETYVSANMTALNARARADKQLMNIPGVCAISDTGISARRW